MLREFKTKLCTILAVPLVRLSVSGLIISIIPFSLFAEEIENVSDLSREWKVFVAPSCHVDVGYNVLQTEAAKNHNENILHAMDTFETDPNFKWNIESAWVVQNYLREYPEEAKDLFRWVKEGRISIQALYINILTCLCSHEELNRICYFAASLKRRYGIKIESAMLTDVTSAVWTLPTVLAGSGIKYFSHGVNNGYDRGPFYPRTDVKPLFWWEGPDGSKVLTWLASGYAQAGAGGLHMEKGYWQLQKTLPKFLSPYEHSDYSCDAVFVHGALWENRIVQPQMCEIGNDAEDWNSEWDYPELTICTNDEFFKYIEKNYDKAEIPTYSGDEGGWWEDGAGSSARETALNRNTHEKIITAEKLWSIISLLGPNKKYPLAEFGQIWDKIMLYDEHTWGADTSISAPESEFVKEQWRVKASFAHNAGEDTESLLKEGLQILSSWVTAGKKPVIFVFNPLSYKRSDIVEVTLKSRKKPFCIIEPISKKEVSYQWITKDRLCFFAENIPPIGYKIYEVSYSKPAPVAEPAVRFFTNGMENKFYRIEFDESNGGISSIWDKELSREFVDKGSKWNFNQYIYAAGGEGTQAIHPPIFQLKNLPPPDFKFFSPEDSQLKQGQNGPVFGEFLVETSCKMTPRIIQKIVLYKDIKRIDFINEFDKEETYKKEAVYFAFPFNFEHPEFKIEIPDGVMRPEKDQLKGACKDWYCVQHWVNVSDKDYTVLWTAPDSPLISLCALNPGKWLETLPLTNGSIFAYVMNNYWHTNYKASQGGGKFRYSITTNKGESNNSEAIRFGWAYANPFLTRFIPSNQKGIFKEKEKSFFDIDRANVILLAMKRAEDENGWILRLFETEGKTTNVSICLPFLKPTRAYLCNLIEENVKELTIEDSKIIVPVEANGIITVRFM